MKFLSILAFSLFLLSNLSQVAHADEVVECKPTPQGNMTCLMRGDDGNLYVKTFYTREP